MKRFHNKSLVGSSLSIVPNSLQCLKLDSKNLWLYLSAAPKTFRTLILHKMDAVDLPLLDMYEIKANSKEGIVVGYAFDSNAKVIQYAPNFLLACNSEFPRQRVNDLNKNCFNMKYRYKGVFLYEYEGMASMVSTGLSEKMQESLELT